MKTKTILISIIAMISFAGCVSTHKRPTSRPVATKPNSALEHKSCEDLLVQEIALNWKKYDAKTQYPGFVKNDKFIDMVLADLKPCIIGKSKDFVIARFGNPSTTTGGSIRYLCFNEGEVKITDAICLIFQFDNQQTINNISFRKCISAADKG